MPGRRSFPSRLAVQVGQIKTAFGRDTVRSHPVGAPDDYTNFLFMAARVLARSGEDAELVRDGLQERFGDGTAVVSEELFEGLTVFTLTGPGADDLNLDGFISDLNDEHHRVVASFDHVLHVTGACCPATEPQLVGTPRNPGDPKPPPPPPVPGVNTTAHVGEGVKVAVIDSGILQEVVDETVDAPGNGQTQPAHPWLTSAPPVTGEEEPDRAGVYTGHGTFVAGVLRCIAPAAEVRVYSILQARGAVNEAEMARRVATVLDDFKPDIVSMSAGTRTTGENILISFEALRDKLEEGEAVLVCAAGNDGDWGPFVPASFDWPEAVAVGALEEDETTRAPYSNHGPDGCDWVNVYARGTAIVNAYPNGPYVYRQPARGRHAPVGSTVQFRNGMAEWSGTSFSTPIVAGLIAVRMKAMSQTPRQAANDLKRIAMAKVVNPGDLPTLTFDDVLKP